MRTQRTHILALRAAGQVTAVSRYFRRAAVGAAASVLIAGSALGCTQDSQAGASFDGSVAESADAASSVEPDVAGLMDTILKTDVADDEDTQMGTSSDALGPIDTGAPDTLVADAVMVDIGTESDAGVIIDAGSVDVGSPDIGVQHDVAMDAGSPDVGDLPEDCLIPNGMACVDVADCEVEGKYGFVCEGGECHEMDFTPNEEAVACCQKQYDAGNFGVAGCNPWGPPAPPLDRGYRLADMAVALGIA